jgi:CheY-like chemotaxis protein
MALQKILINLLGNSLKYTPTDTIVFSLKELEKNDSMVKIRISVADTGLGIPEAKKTSIFEAFEQVDGSLSKKISGTGLGLSIAQQLSYLMKSEIKVISPNPNIPVNSESPGSVFYLDLNLYLSKNIKGNNLEKEQVINTLQLNARSLVVEDNVINQKVISAILKKFGVQVDIASDWRECLTLLETNSYDYIFMDIQMPEVTGFELTKMIRKKGIKTSIIAVSGNVIDGVKDYALKVGMDDFVVKPIKSSEIARMLVKYQKDNKR